jgi:hypothetical protein
MRHPLLAAVVVLVASPAVAQTSRVYTNADLGKPLERVFTVTPEQLAELAAHQFVYVPPAPDGPTVTIVPYTPEPSVYPYLPTPPTPPFFVRTYLGRPGHHGGYGRPVDAIRMRDRSTPSPSDIAPLPARPPAAPPRVTSRAPSPPPAHPRALGSALRDPRPADRATHAAP